MTSGLASVIDSELLSRIENRAAQVGVIGLGYVGLPLVLLFNEQRFPVTGFDIDVNKVRVLTEGGSYIHRIPTTEIQAATGRGFRATSDYSLIEKMDAVIICVPTPLNDHHEPDMSYIVSTVESIAPHLRPGQLVVLESTTYPGTTEEVVIPILEKNNPCGLKVDRGGSAEGNSFYVAFLSRAGRSWQRYSRAYGHSQGSRWCEPGGHCTRLGLIRFHLPPDRPSIQPGCRRDDEAPGEYLPLRKHRPGQRTQAALPAHGH